MCAWDGVAFPILHPLFLSSVMSVIGGVGVVFSFVRRHVSHLGVGKRKMGFDMGVDFVFVFVFWCFLFLVFGFGS